MQQKNFLTFLALAFLLLLLWLNVKQRVWGPPQPPPDKQEAAQKKEKEADKKPADKAPDKGGAPAAVAELPPAPEVSRPDQLIHLVSKDPDARFPLDVTLDPLGAGVREVVDTKFKEADW